MADVSMDDPLVLGSRTFSSRLLVGTGKYKDFEETKAAITESGAQIVTVAVRRVDLGSGDGRALGRWLLDSKLTVLPNTAGCYTVEDTLRTARLAREMLGTPLVKLEVIGDAETLFPDVAGTLEAARVLVGEGFEVMPYVSDDPIACKRLEEMGCIAVMPLAAPIGSGLGIRNPTNLEIILDRAKVPIIVDAGVGTASDAAVAMEMGAAAVLMNTAIAGAKDPIRMARAMKKGIEAGRDAFLAGRIEKRLYATASSPLRGVIGSKH